MLLRFKPADNLQPGGIGAAVAARIEELGGRTPPPAGPAGPVHV